METIINEKVFEIKPFKKLAIGDPSYFEELEKNPENNKHLLDLTCDLKLKDYKKGYAKITEKKCHSEEYNLDYSVITVNFALANREDYLEIYKTDKWFGDKTLVKSYDLGCDTASYEIIVDGRYDEVHTGADGTYGDLKTLKGDYGILGNIDFDGDLFRFEEVLERVKYWFNIK